MKGPKWYGYIYPKNLEIIGARKLLTRDIIESVAFTVDEAGDTAFATGYGITLKEDANAGLHYVLALLNSDLLDFVLKQVNSLLRGGYVRVFTQYLEPLPIRRIHFTTPPAERQPLAALGIAEAAEWIDNAEKTSAESASFSAFSDSNLGRWLDQRLSAEPEQSDVVHDLLAHLAEQMIEMHQQKQQRVAAFWSDLETACESPDTFDTLRNKGKWEASLWKDPACQPYVDRESRSTRHLDESLGWDLPCYEAFAGLLVGRMAVTPALVAVYRAHHEAYKSLAARIASTDALIDQIVYRLYGLTDEEIAVVEGRD